MASVVAAAAVVGVDVGASAAAVEAGIAHAAIAVACIAASTVGTEVEPAVGVVVYVAVDVAHGCGE